LLTILKKPALDPKAFFQSYLAAPIVIVLYIFWKLYTRDLKMYIRSHEMDLDSGLRSLQIDPDDDPYVKTWKNLPIRVFRALF
jgi:yeast amino acid transporter